MYGGNSLGTAKLSLYVWMYEGIVDNLCFDQFSSVAAAADGGASFLDFLKYYSRLPVLIIIYAQNQIPILI